MPTDDDARVEITLRDIWNEVRQLRTEVGLLTFGAAASERAIRDHEDRIRSAERRVFAIPSIGVLVSIAALILSLTGSSSPLKRADAPTPRSTTTTTTRAPGDGAPRPVEAPRRPSGSTSATQTRTAVLRPSSGAPVAGASPPPASTSPTPNVPSVPELPPVGPSGPGLVGGTIQTVDGVVATVTDTLLPAPKTS